MKKRNKPWLEYESYIVITKIDKQKEALDKALLFKEWD